MARSRNTGVKTRRKQRGGNSNNNSNNNTNNYDDYYVKILDNNGESIDAYGVRLYGSPDYDSLLEEITDHIIHQDYFPEGEDSDCIVLEYNDEKDGRGFHIRIACLPENNNNEALFEESLSIPQPRAVPSSSGADPTQEVARHPNITVNNPTSSNPQLRVFPPSSGNDPNEPGAPAIDELNISNNPNNQSAQSGGRRRKAKRTKAKRTRRTKKHSRRKAKKTTHRRRRL